ncbi:MAG: universal stress protein [Chloroflexi bacterium]|nr:universal stress protein [Chloroflexota bacterium]
MFSHILVPLDDSKLSRRAVPFAANLARVSHGRLLLVRAIELWAETTPDNEAAMEMEAEASLASIAEPLRESGIATDWAVYVGEATAAIEAAGDAHAVDAIVMSTRGAGAARWTYGSVAEQVLRTSRRPVLMIPPHCEQVWTERGAKAVVVPLDGSTLAEAALGPAKVLAQRLGASITVVQVVEPPRYAYLAPGTSSQPPTVDLDAWFHAARPYIETVAGKLRGAGFVASERIIAGYPAAAITRVAELANAAAIVMATHGRGGLERVVMGSVSQGVVQRTASPVLLVRPPAAVAVDSARAVAAAEPEVTHVR